MPDFFIGTDILSVPRIGKILKSKNKNRFKTKIFTKKEIEYCDNKPQPMIHYAGRFAAKEAIKKAFLSSEIISNIPFHSIEIINEEGGNPLVNIHSNSIGLSTCKVSISHTEEFAVAFAFLTLS